MTNVVTRGKNKPTYILVQATGWLAWDVSDIADGVVYCDSLAKHHHTQVIT